jgi:hypothetical protein
LFGLVVDTLFLLFAIILGFGRFHGIVFVVLHQDVVHGIGLVDALVVGQFGFKVLFMAMVKENDTTQQDTSYDKKENTIETSKSNHRQHDDES